GQHVVDLALVDVSDDRAPAAALYVQLSDPVAAREPPAFARGALARRGRGGAVARGGTRGAGRAVRLQKRHARLRAIDADKHLLFQCDPVFRCGWRPGRARADPRPRDVRWGRSPGADGCPRSLWAVALPAPPRSPRPYPRSPRGPRALRSCGPARP